MSGIVYSTVTVRGHKLLPEPSGVVNREAVSSGSLAGVAQG